jgi:hypothetical protein
MPALDASPRPVSKKMVDQQSAPVENNGLKARSETSHLLASPVILQNSSKLLGKKSDPSLFEVPNGSLSFKQKETE